MFFPEKAFSYPLHVFLSFPYLLGFGSCLFVSFTLIVKIFPLLPGGQDLSLFFLWSKPFPFLSLVKIFPFRTFFYRVYNEIREPFPDTPLYPEMAFPYTLKKLSPISLYPEKSLLRETVSLKKSLSFRDTKKVSYLFGRREPLSPRTYLEKAVKKSLP